jgi:hypothetical protein
MHSLRTISRAALLTAVATLALSGSVAHATTAIGFDVAPNGSTTSDCQPGHDPCELRHAVALANADGSDVKAVRLAAGDYDLGDTPLLLGTPMTFAGVDSARPRLVSSAEDAAIYSHDGGTTLRHLEIVNPSGSGLSLGWIDAMPAHSTAPDAVEDVVSRAKVWSCILYDIDATMRSSLCVKQGTTPGNGLLFAGNNRGVTMTARNVTAIAASSATSAVELDGAQCVGCNVKLNLVNTIARGGMRDLNVIAGSAVATLDAAYSNFDPNSVATLGANAQFTQTLGHNQSATPVFAGACQENYHESAGSPTVDAGQDNASNGQFDFDGDSRQIGTTDIGADELIPPGPVDACAPVPVTVTPSGATTVPGDLTAPVFASAAMSNTVFSVNEAGPAEALVSARRSARRGTAFNYTLSEPARVVFTIQRASPGRRVKGKCRKPARANRKKRKCTRYALLGRFAQQGVAGRNTKPWSGKIGKRKAKPGRYRATLVATDPAGNHSQPKRLSFRVVRR